MRTTDEDGIIDAMIAMEALLSDGTQEMAHKVSMRLAGLYKIADPSPYLGFGPRSFTAKLIWTTIARSLVRGQKYPLSMRQSSTCAALSPYSSSVVLFSIQRRSIGSYLPINCTKTQNNEPFGSQAGRSPQKSTESVLGSTHDFG
jgi:hypothetical protein